MSDNEFRPYEEYREYPVEEMQERARSFRNLMKRRRTIRDFSDRDVPREIIENCLKTAKTAPSGANRQPWHFCVVSDDRTKAKIRREAEKQEKEFYENRAPEEWLDALEPLGTDWRKPFIETAPYLIVVFAQNYDVPEEGERKKNYYVSESVGIASGMLITALHNAGLATLTHTPSPMDFLRDILNRPDNERAFLNIVTGYPDDDAEVPVISKKSLDDVCTFFD